MSGRHYRLTIYVQPLPLAYRLGDEVYRIEYFEPVAVVGAHIGPHWFADVAPDEKERAEKIVAWLNEQEALPDTVRPAPILDPNKFA